MAVEMMKDKKAYEKLVQESFTFGKKPPIRLTEAEKDEIKLLISQAEFRAKKGNLNVRKNSFQLLQIK